MGLSPPRWWCELKGGRAERRRQVENQGKTRRAGWRGRERREGNGGGVSHRQVPRLLPTRSSGIIATTGNWFTAASDVELRLRKWKTVRPSQSDLSWYDFYVCATEFDVMSSWDLWFCTVNTQPFAVGTRGVYRKRYRDKYCLGRALGVGPFCTTWRKILRLVLLHVATITFQSQRLK